MPVEDPRHRPSDTQPEDPSEEGEGYSPPCYLREVDATYAGHLTAAELIEILNELLEGERAGARATIRFVSESHDPRLRTLMRKISIDEARCCAMLAGHVRALGGMPSAETGAFYTRLTAISDVRERLVFLNRGQGWVVRKLQGVLRCVRDDRLYDDLKTMRRDHEANIRRCNRFLEETKAAP
jgi:nitronate monooxygenase